MNEVISHVVQALDAVDERFYGLDDIAFTNDTLIDTDTIRKLERRFMIEFSLQYAAIMDKSDIDYDGVEYDFEVPKKFMWCENPDLEIRQTFECLNNRRDVDMLVYFETQPDFLVHASQQNMNDQRLIIEAKVNPRAPKGQVYKDIFHTLIYANKYSYRNSVLLLANTELSRWLQWLSDYRDGGLYLGCSERLRDIYVISKQSAQAATEIVTLANYLNA
ncbi:hypothetical protein [Synechococcus sp. CBW1107]|uniref:hypothetical protein n=1 Tax=Synechococcus sp. CBW1107 TaxID=2789857 RepID=UPI002AD4C338|nr:hypothetical protein [Synechococcus sp. CBW1107]CAK6687333.1 hypothetical protein ICNINCKA_00182 [Synechococcus sp. CBW1107]